MLTALKAYQLQLTSSRRSCLRSWRFFAVSRPSEYEPREAYRLVPGCASPGLDQVRGAFSHLPPANLPPSAAALEMLRQSRTNNAPPAERTGLAARDGMKRQCQRVVAWTMALLGLDLAKLCTHRGPPSAAVNAAALRDRGDVTLRQADCLCQRPKLGGILRVAFPW